MGLSGSSGSTRYIITNTTGIYGQPWDLAQAHKSRVKSFNERTITYCSMVNRIPAKLDLWGLFSDKLLPIIKIEIMRKFEMHNTLYFTGCLNVGRVRTNLTGCRHKHLFSSNLDRSPSNTILIRKANEYNSLFILGLSTMTKPLSSAR